MSNAEHTAREQPRVVGRPFPKGVSGNPEGRPRGSKSKLTESFLTDLNAAWNEHGQEALRRCATETPDVFVRTVAQLMPRDLSLSINADVASFAAAFEHAAEVLGVAAPKKLRVLPGTKLIDQVNDGRNR